MATIISSQFISDKRRPSRLRFASSVTDERFVVAPPLKPGGYITHNSHQKLPRLTGFCYMEITPLSRFPFPCFLEAGRSEKESDAAQEAAARTPTAIRLTQFIDNCSSVWLTESARAELPHRASLYAHSSLDMIRSHDNEAGSNRAL